MYTHMEVSVTVELPSVLVPYDLGARFPLRHAQKHDLVPEHVLVVKVGRLRDLCPLHAHYIVRKINTFQKQTG